MSYNNQAMTPSTNLSQFNGKRALDWSGTCALGTRGASFANSDHTSLIGLLGNGKRRRVAVPAHTEVKSKPSTGNSWWKFGSIQKDMIKDILSNDVQSLGLDSVVPEDDLSPRPFGPVPAQTCGPTAGPATLETLVKQPLNTPLFSQMLSMGFQGADSSAPLPRQVSTQSASTTPNMDYADDGFSSDTSGPTLKFRAYQAENWSEKFEELIEFRNTYGHCLVPNSFHENPTLAQWVKRQRYQYKLKQEGKRSTVSDERVTVLEDIGFIWDSHKVVWEERLEELLEYKMQNGNCNVPSRYTGNRQLAIWVKRQRRQYKFYCSNKPSSMTKQRIARLEAVGFEWDLRAKGTTV